MIQMPGLSLTEFIKLREEARLTGTSTNHIIKHYRFTNINRNHDTGTKDLIKWAETHSIYDVFNAMVHYRFMGSPRKYFEGNTGLTSTAYQTPRCNKGQRWREVASDMREGLTKELLPMLLTHYWSSMTGLVDEMIDITKRYNNNGIEYVFHLNEIAKDLAALFPDYIDADSECYIGKGAVIGLMALEGKATKCPTNTVKGKNLRRRHTEFAKIINELRIEPWNFSNMEHALCEFGKYEKIRLFGGGRKRKESKCYTTLIV